MKNLWRWGEIDWDALARSMEKAGYEVNDYEDGTVTTSEITPGEQRCKFAFEQGRKQVVAHKLKQGFIVGLSIGFVVVLGFVVGFGFWAML